MKDQRIHRMPTSYEDKLRSIKRHAFDASSDLEWIQEVFGMVIFRANGSIWSTEKETFQIIVQINPHGCTNLP